MSWRSTALDRRFGSGGVDPYWVWAELTDLRGFAPPATDLPMAFIARLSQGCKVADFVREAGRRGLPLFVPPIYQSAARPERDSPYFTGRTDRAGLRMLPWLGMLDRWEFGVAVRGASGAANGMVPPALTRLGTAPVVKGPPAPRADSLIGIIDDGLAALHEQFIERDAQGAARLRLRLLWDQSTEPREAPWKPAAGLGYGHLLDNIALAGELAALAPGEDETAAYRRWGYLLAPGTSPATRSMWRATHGTHVMHVAAGRDDPLRLPGAGPDAAPDAAARCELAFVGLPDATVTDSSGGSLPVQVLDALRAILDQCTPKAAVAINLSYGCHGGPHDGSSLLELAMDDLIARRKGRLAIVVAAGNSALANAHEAGRVSRRQGLDLQWRIPERDTTDSFLEVWYEGGGGTVSVEVEDPQGRSSGPVEPGKVAELRDGAHTVAAVIHTEKPNNGKGGLALIALAPTLAPRDGASATVRPGIWQVRVRSAKPAEVHAYIERDDPVTGSSKPASAFVRSGPPNAAGTLNGLATGKRTLVAGGRRRSDGARAAYSSQGPTRDGRGDPPPHALADCETDAQTPGILAAAVRSADRFRMNGTSVAAPVMTRWVFNHLASAPTATVTAERGPR